MFGGFKRLTTWWGQPVPEEWPADVCDALEGELRAGEQVVARGSALPAVSAVQVLTGGPPEARDLPDALGEILRDLGSGKDPADIAESHFDAAGVPSPWFIALTRDRAIFVRRLPGSWVPKPKSLPRSCVYVSKFKRALIGRYPILELRLASGGATAVIKLSSLVGDATGLEKLHRELSNDRTRPAPEVEPSD